jgi:tRNA(adenine34) deaminase
MDLALQEAALAYEAGEIPVGAVVVHDGCVVGRGHNQIERLCDPTAHAEMIAIGAATHTLGNKFLYDCTIYVTLEPCAMCAGAMVLSRVRRLVFAAFDPKAGASGSTMNIVQNTRLNHRIEVTAGVLQEESSRLLCSFFTKLRQHVDEEPSLGIE